jgi:hypothetical protein
MSPPCTPLACSASFCLPCRPVLLLLRRAAREKRREENDERVGFQGLLPRSVARCRWVWTWTVETVVWSALSLLASAAAFILSPPLPAAAVPYHTTPVPCTSLWAGWYLLEPSQQRPEGGCSVLCCSCGLACLFRFRPRIDA